METFVAKHQDLGQPCLISLIVIVSHTYFLGKKLNGSRNRSKQQEMFTLGTNFFFIASRNNITRSHFEKDNSTQEAMPLQAAMRVNFCALHTALFALLLQRTFCVPMAPSRFAVSQGDMQTCVLEVIGPAVQKLNR